jgi:hypothetical protein
VSIAPLRMAQSTAISVSDRSSCCSFSRSNIVHDFRTCKAFQSRPGIILCAAVSQGIFNMRLPREDGSPSRGVLGPRGGEGGGGGGSWVVVTPGASFFDRGPPAGKLHRTVYRYRDRSLIRMSKHPVAPSLTTGTGATGIPSLGRSEQMVVSFEEVKPCSTKYPFTLLSLCPVNLHQNRKGALAVVHTGTDSSGKLFKKQGKTSTLSKAEKHCFFGFYSATRPCAARAG